MPPADSPLVALVDVRRTFPGVVALDGVSFDVRAGEVHALVGENGAGKSTLINLLSGVLAPESGEILVDGRPARFASPPGARRLGILAVHQEAELFAPLSVAENLALETGLPLSRLGLVDWRAIERDARSALRVLGRELDVRRPAADLSVAQRQLAQLAAAVARSPRVLILDEPTAALSADEARWLFSEIDRLKQRRTGIVYISHRQEEVFELADRITVLRDGRRVWSGVKQDVDPAGLLRAMVGRDAAPVHHRPPPQSVDSAVPCALRVAELRDVAGLVRGASLTVRPGEIVGLYGLVGAGRSELARTIFGLEPVASGTVDVAGERCAPGNPRRMLAAGVAYLPEDRLSEGVCRGLSVRNNATLSSLARWSIGPWVRRAGETAATAEQVASLGIKCRSVEQPIGQLSGGNQQKVVLARALLTEPRVLLLDEPTRGVDVAAKAEIHRILRELTARGVGILLISSELPEVLAHCDRVLAYRDGRVAGEFDPRHSGSEEIAKAAFPQSGATGGGASAAPRRAALPARWLSGQAALGLGIAALAAALTATQEGFASPANLLTVAANAAAPLILALAAAAAILAGAIDISLGALVALAAGAGGLVLKSSLPATVAVPAGIATSLAVGAAGGAINAAVALLGRVHPIVVTLGTMTVYRGLLIALTGGGAIVGLPPAFDNLATGRSLGIPGGVWCAVGAVAAVYLWLGHTRSGRHLYAVGASPTAARFVGLSPARSWPLAMGIGGLLAGLAGLVELAQSGSMQSTMGTRYELYAITAAVLGGVAISGGRGRVAGVVLASLLLTLVSKARVAWEISPTQEGLLTGGLLLAAVVLDRLARRKRP